jgi:hypothetical protein
MTSNLREKLKIILQTYDSISRQNGIVEKDTLCGKIEIDEAGELIRHLLKEGILKVTRSNILE